MSTAPLPTLGASPGSPAREIPWRHLVMGILLFLPAAPLLVLHGRQLWLREHYQFFPFVVIGSALLGYTRLKGFGPLVPGGKVLSYTLLSICWALLATAGLLCSPWLGMVSTLLLIGAIIYTIGGRPLFWRLLPAWVFLWLMVPPPLNLDQRLVTGLQARTARWSSRVLDFLGVIHVMQGNIVAVPGKRLFVEEACSGINSLFTMIACSVFYVFWFRRSLVRSVLLVLSATGWVLVANVIRVVGVAYMFTRWKVDLIEGWPHEVFGWVVFTATLLLILSTDRLLLSLDPLAWFRSKDPLRDAEKAAIAGAASAEDAARDAPFRWPDLVPWPVAVAFGALGVLQVLLLVPTAAIASTSDAALVQRLETIAENVLPAQREQWQRQKFEATHRERGAEVGEYSRIWRYRWGHKNAVVSLDYAFAGWHELTECYQSAGWSLEKRVVQTEEATPGDAGWYWVEVDLRKPLEQQAYLLFSVTDEFGRPVQPFRDKGLSARLGERLTALRGLGRTLQTDGLAAEELQLPSFQVQLMIESYTSLTVVEKRQAQAFYKQVSQALRKLVTNQQEKHP